jgi:hypothetical protein
MPMSGKGVSKALTETDGCTTMSMSASLNLMIWSINAKSTLTPPYGHEMFPSKLVPPEYGTIGTRYLWHIAAILDTSAVDFG